MKNQKGFTLIEILLALTLSSFVFVIVSTLIMTLFTANTKSRRSESLQQVKNDLFVELSNSIRWAKVINIDQASNSLVLDAATYTLNNGAIYKNGAVLTPGNVEVTSFEMREAVTVAEYPGVELTIEFENKVNGLNSEIVNIFVANRKVEVDI